MHYKTVITKLGDLVSEIAGQGMLIVFNADAPPELAELSVLHTAGALERDVQANDTVLFGNNEYVVTAVGEEASHTLRKMGHCSFGFTGGANAEMPGQIMLAGGNLPSLQVGDPFEIHFQ